MKTKLYSVWHKSCIPAHSRKQAAEIYAALYRIDPSGSLCVSVDDDGLVTKWEVAYVPEAFKAKEAHD